MSTILPEAPPARRPLAAVRFGLPRLRTPALVLVVLLVGLAGAVGARAWTGRLPGPDKPGGKQLPLTTTVGLPASRYNPAFGITLPQEPRLLANPATLNETIMTASLTPGRAIPFLLFVSFPHATPRESIDAVSAGDMRLGPVRETRVGGRAAFARDAYFSDKVIHEYRFEVDGAVYGVGILTTVGDEVGHDTGVAALNTLTFDV